MLIGITYDLCDHYRSMGFSEEDTAELDHIETIKAIEAALSGLGYETERIGGIEPLAHQLSGGRRWDLVFNIAEGMWGQSREAQVPALLDAYRIPYTFSGPLALSLALHKGMAKRVLRDAGIPTPGFAVLEDMGDLYETGLSFPLFAKPVAEGSSKGVDGRSKVHDIRELEAVFIRLLHTFHQPVLAEEYLPGREFSVGIVGTGRDARAIGVMEIVLKDPLSVEGYSYQTKKNYEKAVEYRPAADAAAKKCAEIALNVWKCLGCQDAGRVDLKMDGKGMPNFLEVNPLAGLHPVRSDLPILSGLFGIGYRQLIGMIMESCLKRIHLDRRTA